MQYTFYYCFTCFSLCDYSASVVAVLFDLHYSSSFENIFFLELKNMTGGAVGAIFYWGLKVSENDIAFNTWN